MGVKGYVIGAGLAGATHSLVRKQRPGVAPQHRLNATLAKSRWAVIGAPEAVHQRSNQGPSAAPTPAGIRMPSVYQTATNRGEVSVQ